MTVDDRPEPTGRTAPRTGATAVGQASALERSVSTDGRGEAGSA